MTLLTHTVRPYSLLFSVTLSVVLVTSCSKREQPVPVDNTPHARPADQGASTAIYFVLRNPAPDTMVLYGVEIDAAGGATIHRSMEADDMASMSPVDSVIVPPGDSVRFAPRGLHVMASNLVTPFRSGDTVVVRLRLRPARVDTMRVAIRE
jgi:periplasmic copper chaperone A